MAQETHLTERETIRKWRELIKSDRQSARDMLSETRWWERILNAHERGEHQDTRVLECPVCEP